MTDQATILEGKSCFILKANFFPCTLIQLMQYDLEALQNQLITTINKAPNFFMGTPLVIDIEMIKNFGLIDFSKLKEIFLSFGMIPVGIRGGSSEQQKQAATIGIPVLNVGKSTPIEETSRKKIIPKKISTKIVNHPVRSGMQIYAKESDLIVTAPVSPGAEILADGNIHVYGPLRGRALAGVQGDIQARIFCRTLESELVSIAGYYLMKDDIQIQDTMVQVYLDGEQLKVQAL